MLLPAAGLIIAAAPATERRRCRGRPPFPCPTFPGFHFVGADRARSNFVVGTLPIRSAWEAEMRARSKA